MARSWALARTRLFSRRYGVAAIFVGRFLGPLRAFVPLMAGMTRMKMHSFQLANLASAFVWVGALLSPAWLARLGLQVVSPTDLALGVAAIALLGPTAWMVVRRSRKPALLTPMTPCPGLAGC